VSDVVLLDRSSLAIEQYNAVILSSPVNPDKITEFLIQIMATLSSDRDALVIPVPALILPAVGATPHWTFLHHGSTVKAQVPLMVIGSLRCGGALDGQLCEGYAFGRRSFT
jgi:hypothetical protein